MVTFVRLNEKRYHDSFPRMLIDITDTTNYGMTIVYGEMDNFWSQNKCKIAGFGAPMILVLSRWHLADPFLIQDMINTYQELHETSKGRTLCYSYITNIVIWISLQTIARDLNIDFRVNSEGFVATTNDPIVAILNEFIRHGEMKMKVADKDNVDIFDFLNSIAYTRGLTPRKVTTFQLMEQIVNRGLVDIDELPEFENNLNFVGPGFLEFIQNLVDDRSAMDGVWTYDIHPLDLTYPTFYQPNPETEAVRNLVTNSPLATLVSLIMIKYIDKFDLEKRDVKVGLLSGEHDDRRTIDYLPNKRTGVLLLASAIAECYSKIKLVMNRGRLFIPNLNLKKAANGYLQKLDELPELKPIEQWIFLHLAFKDLIANMDFDTLFHCINKLSQLSDGTELKQYASCTLISLVLAYDSVAGTSFLSVFC